MALRAPKTPITVADLKADELYGVVIQAVGESSPYADAAIQRKLIAAEDEYERALSIRFAPTRVFSDAYGRQQGVFPAGSPAELPGDFSTLNDLTEPAYNYTTDFYGAGRWGEMDLNYRPVRSITKLWFAFPGTNPIWTVPKEWIRLDQKFGSLQIVPSTSAAAYASFNAYILSTLSGGRGLPHAVFIDYETGFTAEELETHHNDLLEGVRLLTLLSLLPGAGVIASPGGGSGGSLGLDGLSRSHSFGGKYGPYSGRILAAIDREGEIRRGWAAKERGLVMTVLGSSV